MKSGVRRAFFLGVGGMGMAPLAIYLVQSGWVVHGLDDDLSEEVKALLESHYIGVMDSWALQEPYDVLVYSNAIVADDARLVEARAAGLRTVLRGEMLAECARGKKLLAVVGSHGKTTTTAMLVHVLRREGVAFSYVLGGLFADPRWAPAGFDEGAWLVAELDESDGTIDLFDPAVTVMMDLHSDHAAQYADWQALADTFVALAGRTQESLVYCQGTASAQLLQGWQGQADVLTVGAGGDVPYGVESMGDGSLSLRLELPGLGEVVEPVRAMGHFNAMNAAMALAGARLLRGQWCGGALADFCGVYRRQEVLFADEACVVMQDYAHHPEEVKRLLQLAGEYYPDHDLQVVFQPHRFSRTRMCKQEFADILGALPQVHLLEVYAASEPFDALGASEEIVRLSGGRLAGVCRDVGALLEALLSTGVAPRLLLFIGAGDIVVHAEAFAAAWRQRVLRGAQGRVWFSELASRVGESTVLRLDEPLANKTTFRLGGAAAFYAEPADEADLCAVVAAARGAGVPMYLLGRGSNVLVPEEGFAGLVLRLRNRFWRDLRVEADGRIHVRVGVGLKELSSQAARHGWAGFEFMEGIPGCVGGALRMNAGAMGGAFFDVVESVRVLTPDGEIESWPRERFHFAYRSCEELQTHWALSAVLRGQPSQDQGAIQRVVGQFAEDRKASQPNEPSAGCIFKNPAEGSAGKMIDEAALKGSQLGGAVVSPVHANFMVNGGGATFDDVVALVRRVRSEVRQKKGVDLQPEVLILGGQWSDYL